MKKNLFILFFLMSAIVMNGQGTVRFCYNDGELIGGKWQEVEGVSKEDKVKHSPFYGFVFSTEDKQLKKLLREQAFYVQFNDTLYINCYRAIGEGVAYYARAERGKEADNVFFVSDERASAASISTLTASAGLLGGIIGGAIAGAAIGASRGLSLAPYLWSMESGTPQRLTPKVMKKLRADYPQLLKKYKAEDKKRQATPGCIYEYLLKLKLL